MKYRNYTSTTQAQRYRNLTHSPRCLLREDDDYLLKVWATGVWIKVGAGAGMTVERYLKKYWWVKAIRRPVKEKVKQEPVQIAPVQDAEMSTLKYGCVVK